MKKQIIRIYMFMIVFALPCLSEAGNKELYKYYPLAVGNAWVWRMGNASEPTEGSGVTMYLQEDKAYIIKHITPIGDYEECVAITDDAVYQIARNSPLNSKFQHNNPKQIILKAPLQIGTQWENKTFSSEKEVFRIVDLVYKYEVPAGEFREVVKIEKSIFVKNKKLKWEDRKEWKTYQYYAPYVGLIKEEMSNGTNYRDLASYRLGR